MPKTKNAPNIVDIAAGSDDFQLLVRALSAANLVHTVRDLDDVTVFAPTDAAFTQLAVDLGYTDDTSDEDAVFAFLVQSLTDLSPDNDPIPLLTDILLYHVSADAKSASDIDALGEVETLLTDATFKTAGPILVDNEPDVANPTIVIPDIDASNGVIQAIDRVLLPLDIPGNEGPAPTDTLTGIVAASGGVFDNNNADFDILLNAVQAAGLAGALDDPHADLTVFAPTDAAFIDLAQTLGFEGHDEGEAFAYIVEALKLLSGGGDPIPLLTNILLYHVAPESFSSDEVLTADEIATLLGANIGVDGLTLVDNDPDLDDPQIVDTDIVATNGIAHVIDGVLIPADILNGDGGRGSVDFEIGDDGHDQFRTGDNTDFVSGLGGNDEIRLGKGNDVGLGGDGNDELRGGRGDDTLDGGHGRDGLIGGRGNDDMSGGNGNDLMHGGMGNDTIDGGNQNDVLRGNQGSDNLDGGAGRDLLIGGRHSDVLTGGDDADTFVFHGTSGSDTIKDFTIGEDLIALKIDGVQDFDDIDHLISESGDGAVITIGQTEITLEHVDAHSLSESDFIFT
ncbi:MAG: fasciclin domain-containing protein [Pseudomonadota bacterium]